jgi:hypothetical protein
VQRNARFRQVRGAESVIPYVLVVYIAFDDDSPRAGPCPPLCSLGGQVYVEVLVGYKPGVLPEYFSSSFLPCPTSFTTV